MANGATHRWVAATVVGSACLYAEKDQQHKSAKPFIGAALGAALTNIPDILEPALHSHHRQFFHSLAFATLLSTVGYKVYKWEPDNRLDEAIRFVVMVGIGAYLIHLLLDASTPRSLPLIGRL